MTCAVVSDQGKSPHLPCRWHASTFRHYRTPELLFSPLIYVPSAIDIWSLGVVITDCLNPSPHASLEYGSEDSDRSSDYDPLDDDTDIDTANGSTAPKRLFDDTFGDLGLAASIFRVLGTPSEKNWPVSLLDTMSYVSYSSPIGVWDVARCW